MAHSNRRGVSPMNRALSRSNRSSGRTAILFGALMVVLALVIGGLVLLPLL
jgi:Flp pilus assembly protein TadG